MSGASTRQRCVSVVISCFDYERFVGQAIASALDQPGCAVEVIVVDDGSSDASPEAIGAFGDRVRVIEQSNQGQASAISEGFAVTRGEAVVFLDADDLLLPSAACSALQALSDRTVAKAHWPMPIIDAQGDRTAELQDPELVEGDLRAQVAAEGPLSDSVLPSPPMSGNAFSRRFLEQVMPVPELYRLRADDYLSGLAPAFGAIALLPPQSLYRIHGENLHLERDFEWMLDFEQRHCTMIAGIVAKLFEREGRAFDAHAWQRSAWGLRLGRAVRAIEQHVPAGERLALIDEGLLGVQAELHGRAVVAFPERDGAFAGSPASDARALCELERLRAASIRYVALAWPAFWWLDEYPGLAAALRRDRRVLRSDPDVVIYGPAEA
jgi:hypothetical protein